MSAMKIQGSQYTINKVFSDDFAFVIPHYQRPYRWTTEQAGELFDDLHGTLKAHPDVEVDDLLPYFLKMESTEVANAGTLMIGSQPSPGVADEVLGRSVSPFGALIRFEQSDKDGVRHGRLHSIARSGQAGCDTVLAMGSRPLASEAAAAHEESRGLLDNAGAGVPSSKGRFGQTERRGPYS